MELTRRYFLQSSGALAAYLGCSPLRAFAAGEPALGNKTSVIAGKTLVTIFLRGGTDGLNLVVPYGDDDYYKSRKAIAIARPGQDKGAIDLDGFFGLHPSASALTPLFQQGTFQALHAVGYDHNTRSHFEEQDVWETGVIGNTVNSDGWLNRHLQTSTGDGLVRALSIGDALPRILHGNAPAYAVRGIKDLALPDMKMPTDKIQAALEHAYMPADRHDVSDSKDLINQTGSLTLEGVKLLEKIIKQPYEPAAQYPQNDFSKKLQEVARLIKSDIGLEVVEVTLGGWDTHNRQGGAEGGFANKVKMLSEGLAAFTQDLGSHLDNTLILTLSDFGRTVKENGTEGTDHGWANCMFMGGGPIREVTGGKPAKVRTEWPGLSPEQLYQKRDLLHTTDFRDVIADVVQNHLGNDNLQKILPGHEFNDLHLFRPAEPATDIVGKSETPA
ncbi:MAG: DUF1501 domain-containing protein [Verrucomicrobiota bacterium]